MRILSRILNKLHATIQFFPELFFFLISVLFKLQVTFFKGMFKHCMNKKNNKYNISTVKFFLD